jgi:uroporphyrinogen III methyltransferase / synthase
MTGPSALELGRVYLVGAGPGDPGLMTVRGLDVLRRADVVVYDRLVNPVLLEEAPRHAVRRFAGKRCGRHELEQPAINRLLVAEARRGHEVVRLKGGDPFVFGRGGEEAQALAAAGIPFEIVPGVSSAIAVPAYAGIPLTHRAIASSFAVVTGHEEDGRADGRVDWSHLAGAVDTLVVLMPAQNLRRIARELVTHGRPPDTPVALIRWGTTEAQETCVTTLGEVAGGGATPSPPVVAVIGHVVSLREALRWFDGPGSDLALAALPAASPLVRTTVAS